MLILRLIKYLCNYNALLSICFSIACAATVLQWPLTQLFQAAWQAIWASPESFLRCLWEHLKWVCLTSKSDLNSIAKWDQYHIPTIYKYGHTLS